MAELTQVRGSCADGRTCPAVLVARGDGELRIVGRRVTDPAELAQMAIGPDEIAIAVPASLLPEVSGDAGH